MKLIIHGTRGGWRIVYPTGSAAPFVVSDFSVPTINLEVVGGEVYSIAFDSGACIFSKYRIISDNTGPVIGNVAISLNVPPCKKLSGLKIKELLDNMLTKYCDEYAPTNNLSNVRENWSPFDVEGELASYEALTTTISFQSFTRGVGKAAFIYYDGNIERYLDDPFWKVYKEYKQVFFVSNHLKDSPESPLTALLYNPTADLTEVIDLDNPEYVLVSGIPTNSNITADVKVNSVTQVPGNTVGKKGLFEITYKKRNCQDCTISHTWDDPALLSYVNFDDKNKRIFIRPIDPSRLVPVNPNSNETSGESKPVAEPTTPTVESNPNQPPPIPHQEKVILLSDDMSGDWKLEAKVTG
jgi:hypothetical protein